MTTQDLLSHRHTYGEILMVNTSGEDSLLELSMDLLTSKEEEQEDCL